MLRPLLIAALIVASPAAAQDFLRTESRVQQLRIYEIFEANRAAFHARFRDHAMRIMARHGFRIVAMWETRIDGKPHFAYVLDWPDQATMATRWKAFLADPEWIRIKQESAARHGQMVGAIQDRTLRMTDYSPELK